MSKLNLFNRPSMMLLAVAAFALLSDSAAAQECPYSKECPSATQPNDDYQLVAYQETVAKPDIVDTAVAAGDFNTLVVAVKAAGLVETLKGEGPFTVFAPADAAFAQVDADTLENLLKPENKEALTSILTYHVVKGKVMASDVVKIESAETVNGKQLKIAVNDGKVMINNAQVVSADIECGNGVIHVVDSVLMPPADDAEQTLTSAKAGKDIVDTAVAAENFSTLVAAVKAAGLVDTLKGEGPFTVFAPTDEAFSKIPKETIADLLKPENKEKLQAILTYHVVPGKVMAADVVKLTTAKTANGEAVDIAVADGGVSIDNAKVTATDIKCANGVIHVIDTVLMP
jgi:uncharacterized surface protein with fasciclin (FAS1) repeats